MSPWERLAEDRINEAIAAGEFENLPGHGSAIDLTNYFTLPATERIAVSLLKNAQVIPPELELLKEAERLERELSNSTDPAMRRRLQQQIESKRVAFALAMEHRRKRERGP